MLVLGVASVSVMTAWRLLQQGLPRRVLWLPTVLHNEAGLCRLEAQAAGCSFFTRVLRLWTWLHHWRLKLSGTKKEGRVFCLFCWLCHPFKERITKHQFRKWRCAVWKMAAQLVVLQPEDSTVTPEVWIMTPSWGRGQEMTSRKATLTCTVTKSRLWLDLIDKIISIC